MNGYILLNSRPNYGSKFISAIKDFQVARNYSNMTNNLEVRIDLNKLPKKLKFMIHIKKMSQSSII